MAVRHLFIYLYTQILSVWLSICEFPPAPLLKYSWGHHVPSVSHQQSHISPLIVSYKQLNIAVDVPLRIWLRPLHCCFSRSFLLQRCQHDVGYHTLWFSAGKVWRLLCEHVPVSTQNVSLQGTLSLRQHKGAEQQPECGDTEPPGFKMGLILMECGQWIVLLGALLANGVLFSSVLSSHSGGFWEPKCFCSWFYDWPHLSTLLMWWDLTASDLVQNSRTLTANSVVSHHQERWVTRVIHTMQVLY